MRDGASDKSDRATHEQSPQAVSADTVGIPSACRNCDGVDWVCENHPDKPWGHLSCRDDACTCGAGSPCRVCQPEMANAPLIHSIAQEARRYAAFYAPGSDGRNTFEMFAEFVETRAIAQAIEARRAETQSGSVHESAVAESHAPDPAPSSESDHGA